ncbi:unnamed protein product [Phytophthora lilii]|uniref:Unnamed protein product n=1 Tax=Phytophthora lilii TaxID=2077276 RepID=A0A9W6YJ43_9STRA|nr:unnamed protein product [Phytophthora lilii]
MSAREEVVIDGDSTEEDEEVRIISPQSRKRRRRSNILIDQDEDEDEQDAQLEKAPPRRQQQLLLGRDGVSSQPMTLRTPTPTRRSRRNLQQLSISAAVSRGERGRQQEADKDDPEEEEDEDEVRIIQPPSAGSVSSRGSSGRKNRRPAIQDSDEKIEASQKEQEQEQQNSDGEQEVEIEETSSASRRSSRIEHKRKEKEAQHSSARKLDYPVLDNCLDNLQGGPHFKGGDGDDENDEDYNEKEESEPEEAPPPPKKRRRPVDREEKVYADGGEDVDDFICDDDEIEYMDDDEEGVISVETSDDEVGEDDPEELTAILAAGRSREMHEWFTIYLEYLEECIIDPDFENKVRRKRSKAKYQIYDHAVSRVSVAWPEDMVDALKHASLFRSSKVAAEQDCDACNRRQHVATYHVDFAGAACDATKLYGPNWMRQYVYKLLQNCELKNGTANMCPLCDIQSQGNCAGGGTRSSFF